ncbi:hypothetical protein GCM10011402_11160 [Paracoccus acridae]|uniref:Uncharacterized protein n=1 Tax=Paracoccus acridae TaxID=1795310 RepID=A0ABQ1VEV8_9RHOB|nr:hypothetical protein GCM10011402_11160 [Paracoccus acridae]
MGTGSFTDRFKGTVCLAGMQGEVRLCGRASGPVLGRGDVPRPVHPVASRVQEDEHLRPSPPGGSTLFRKAAMCFGNGPV